MAIEEQELAPGAENEEPEQPENPEAEPPAELPSVEVIAKEIGWVPREEYTGPEELWKPADQFIRDGRDIQRETARELKGLRATVDTIVRTTASVAEQEVNRRVDQLATQYNKAVEDGDATQAFRLSQEIGALTTRAPAERPAPTPDAQGFAERNKAWFKTAPTAPGDPLATARAIDICNTLAAQGYDAATQLEAAERQIKREFPHLFTGGLNGKPQASVSAPGARGPQGNGGKPKGFAEMPAEAQKVANDMVARGVIPDRDSYVKNYWANTKG